ncbi:SDR family oxidoreductase [Pedobacter sp. LMG 31464]|uniref:SDR family oxidoreductase n=2 Tax=Pedobacter planticolens TaxID=2679964 RepID=A0A923IXA5_9SPHI|nr:SDR family oxidoreductase [Pedobacter planticolens]
MSLEKVLITGASRGIGLAIAEKLAGKYQLILHATTENSFTKFIPNSEILCADFSDPAQVSQFCKQLKKEHGNQLVAIINNAGITKDNAILFQSEKDIDSILNINLRAPIMISKTAMKIFAASKKGTIINMSSISAHTGNAFQSIYAATKAGLIAFSKSLAKEAGVLNESHQIRVLSISPGYIETDMTTHVPAAEKEKFLALTPSRKFGKAEEVAALVAFLLSEEADFINGSDIPINGGLA